MNRFAHLKEGSAQGEVAEGLPAQPVALLEVPDLTSVQPTLSPDGSDPAAAPEPDDLQEVTHLVERRIGIVGKIPASVKDAYDEMLLRTRRYIGRPNSDLAVQAWVELTLEDEAFQRRWLKRMQDLRRK